MPVADVEVDHIDHKAMPQAIEQVAQRAADNQRVGNIVQLWELGLGRQRDG